jgi:hypothetical protein
MKKIVSALFATLVGLTLVACGGGSKAPAFVGDWTVDVDSMMAQMPNADKMDDAMKEQARAMLGKMSISVSFKEDGTASFNSEMMGKKDSEAGKWELVKTEKNTYSVKMVSGDNKKEETFDIVVDGNKMTMDKDGEKLHLMKK